MRLMMVYLRIDKMWSGGRGERLIEKKVGEIFPIMGARGKKRGRGFERSKKIKRDW